MEKKKRTKAQLQRRLDTAILHIDSTKSTQTIYFSDKGLRLTADDECAVIGFGYNQVVFRNFNISGLSRPWLYTKRIVEITSQHLKEIQTETGYSYARLLDVLNSKEDKTEYNIATYYDWYIYNLYQPLYGIAEDNLSAFLVYEDYIHNIARNSIMLDEHKEDMTNKQFIKKVHANMNNFVNNMEEEVVLHKLTDDEVVRQNIEAVQEHELNESMEEMVNGSTGI